MPILQFPWTFNFCATWRNIGKVSIKFTKTSFYVQLTKILLLPQKFKIIMLPSTHSFFQYCDSNIWLFTIVPPLFIASNNYNSNSCRSFVLVNTLAKSNGKFKTRKSDNYHYRDSWKSDNFIERAIKKEAKNWYKKGCKED